MQTLRRIQWLIAAGVSLWAVKQVPALGVTSVVFLVPALAYVGAAALLRRGSRIAVGIAVLLNALLAYVCGNLVVIRLGPPPAAAPPGVPIPRRPDLADPEVLLPALLLIVIVCFLVSVVRGRTEVRRAPWI